MKDGVGKSIEPEVPLPPFSHIAPSPETQNIHKLECSTLAESEFTKTGTSLCGESLNGENCGPSDEKEPILSATHSLQCNDSDVEMSS